MWNSNRDTSNNDSADQKRVHDMSAALNISPDRLQQFMTGQVSLESLTPVTSQAILPSTPVRTQAVPLNTDTWTSLQQPNVFHTTTYESTSLSDILAGPVPATPLPFVATSLVPTTPHSGNTFGSPTSLMELNTVTPSRIGSSPHGIIMTKHPQSSLVDDQHPLSLSSSESTSLPPTSSIGVLQPVTQSTLIPLNPPCESNQFKIVIGEPENAAATKHIFVDLGAVSNEIQSPEEEQEVAETLSSQNDEETKQVISDADDDSDSECISTIQTNFTVDMDRAYNESKKQARKGIVSKLPKELRGLMGEANLCYARGNHEDAIKMCMEIVRLAPYAGEPFETLAMIYDEKEEPERSLQYSLLAAHLSKTDAEQWIHLAEMCTNQGDDHKALSCYKKAVKLRPTDYKLQLECGKILLSQQLLQKAMAHYKSAINLMPPDEGERALEMVEDLSKICHDGNANSAGIELLEQAFESHRVFFDDKHANILCELYLLENRYISVLELLVKHSSVQIAFEDENSTGYDAISKLEVSSSVMIDLRCKLCMAAIRIGRGDLVEDIVKSICDQSNPSEISDIQFELAETYMAMEDFSNAIKILDNLVSMRNCSLAAFWLRHAECNLALANTESALASYKQCVRLAPGHVAAHLMYSRTLRSVNKHPLANQTLDIAENFEIEPKTHMKLYHERYLVCKSWGEKNKRRRDRLALACDVALLMFVNRFRFVAFKEGKIYLRHRRKPWSFPTSGQFELVQIRTCDTVNDLSDIYLKGDVDIFTKDEWLQFFDEVISLLLQCQRFRDAANLAEGMQWYSRWCENIDTRRHFQQTQFCACILRKDYRKAYSIMSPWLRADLSCNYLWNIFNQLIAKTEDQRHQKFCPRLLYKYPDHLPLVILSAHNCMASGSYKVAAGEYLRAHKQVPSEPLYSLLCGVAFTNLASQKFTVYKHSIVAQALVYFNKYLKDRECLQESYYNIGRAMHQLGLEHFAIHYYQRALLVPTPDVLMTGKCDSQVFDLRREIGFNLSLIYRKSGNHAVANEMLVKYCIV